MKLKKTITLATSLILSASMIVGCSNKTNNKTEGGTTS